MSDEDELSEGFLCVTQQSANKLKFTISLSATKGHNADAKSLKDSDESIEVTGRNLYTVLCDIHNQLVRRDPRGIFANPVTDEIAAGYSQTISHPMDLGTIYTRLCSRSFYHSASEYLSDVTLMCENAMIYNPPDTIYYQRARKLLAYCRKQMTPTALRKLCDNLGLTDGLQDSELGDISSLIEALPRHYKLGFSRHRRLSSKESLIRSSSRMNNCSVRLDRLWHGAQRNTSTGGVMRFGTARTAAGHEKRKVGRPRHTDRMFNALQPRKHDRMTSQRVLGSPKCEVSTRSPTAESTPIPSKPLQISNSTSKSKQQPTGRPRGRPRKIPRPSRTPPPPVVGTESDNSLPNSPPHLSTISSSSPSSTSAARRATGSCPSPISSPTHADSPASRSISCVSDAPSTIASTGNTQLEASVGTHSTSNVLFTPPSQAVVTPTNPELLYPTLEPVTTTPSVTASNDFVPTPVVKRGRGRPPKLPRPTATTPTCPDKITVSPEQSKKRTLSGAAVSISAKRKATASRSMSPITPADEEAKLTEAVVVAKAPVPRSDATTQVEDDVLEQARQAAELAAMRLRSKYTRLAAGVQKHDDNRIGPRVVYLDCESPGQVNAIECPWVQSSERLMRMDLGHSPPDRLASDSRPIGTVNYPEVLNQILTGYRSRSEFAPNIDLENESTKTRDLNSRQKPYVPLVNPFNAEQLEELKQLGKLKYNPDEPISAAFHGPLAVFSPEELGQMAEIYGGDISVMEYAFSLLTFVEPIGRWARRLATKQLDAATDGLHSQFAMGAKTTELNVLREFENVEPQFPMWMRTAGLTVDSPSPPCSPKAEAHAVEFEDDSATPLLHSLSQLDPSAPLPTESSIPIMMDGQTVSNGTADPGTISNAVSFSHAPAIPIPNVPTDTIPTSSEHIPVSIAYDTAMASVSKTAVTSSSSSPVLSDTSAKPILLESVMAASSYHVPGDATSFLPHSDLVSGTTSDTEKPEESNRSECLTTSSYPSESDIASGTPVTCPDAVVEANKSGSQLDEVLTSPSVTPSNSLLKSALHAAGNLPTVVDRSSSLVINIPISQNDNLSQKHTPRSDSLVQHSPQVTVSSDVSFSGSRLEALVDMRPDFKDTNTAKTEHKPVVLTGLVDSVGTVLNQKTADTLGQMPSFHGAQEVTSQLSSPSTKLNELDCANPQFLNKFRQDPAETAKSEEVLPQPDLSFNLPHTVEQTRTIDQPSLKTDDEKLDPNLDSISIAGKPELSPSSTEGLLINNEESFTLECPVVECSIKSEEIEKEPGPYGVVSSASAHGITETGTISSEIPRNSEENENRKVMDPIEIPLTGSLERNQSECGMGIAKTDDSALSVSSSHHIDSEKTQQLSFIRAETPSVIPTEAERSPIQHVCASFVPQNSAEVIERLSHSLSFDAVCGESSSSLNSQNKPSKTAICQASEDVLTLHTENTALLVTTEPCSLEPIIIAPVEPSYSKCIMYPSISSPVICLEEATLIAAMEPCSLEPTTTDLEEPPCKTQYTQPTILSSTSIVLCPSESEIHGPDRMIPLSNVPISSGCATALPDSPKTCENLAHGSPVINSGIVTQTSALLLAENSELITAKSQTEKLFTAISNTDQSRSSPSPIDIGVVGMGIVKQLPEEKQCDLSTEKSEQFTSLALEPESVQSGQDGQNAAMCCHDEAPRSISNLQMSTALDVVDGDSTEIIAAEAQMIHNESSEFTGPEAAFADSTNMVTQISTPFGNDDKNDDGNTYNNTNE